MGFSVHSSGDPQSDETFAYVRLENDQVMVHCVIAECGNGQRLGVAKVAAELLHVPLERVTVVAADNGVTTAALGLEGSSGTTTA